MEDILASIRRILSEDEQQAKSAPAPAEDAPRAAAGEPEVVELDESMLVAEPELPAPEEGPRLDLVAATLPQSPPPQVPPPTGAPAPPPAAGPERLIAPEAEAAAAGAMSSLLRTLEAGRAAPAVYRGGPTLEDIVREEMRPLLKAWLDSNLPPLVERLVRAEIERLVGRALT
jgi:cell pole-organizing protein PopZ